MVIPMGKKNSILLKTRVFDRPVRMAQDNVNRRDVTSCYVLFRPTFRDWLLILQPQ
jgi:hypothetical protein